LTIDGNEYDFRLSTLPVHEGESVVMRILDKSKVLIKLDEIGFNPTNTAKFRHAMQSPHGIVFVTGPTGSGKTTTLYAGLNEIKNVNRKIITVEDPIEYQMNLIQQVQVNEKADLTFAAALRSILRQDPDIIMVGESRDMATLSIAVQAALTGHLVFTTLHTNDSVSAITRIVDMGIEPFLVASSIVAIQAQRLVRKVCPYCQTPVTLPEEVMAQILPHIKGIESPTFVKGRGCKKCNMSGYSGRTIISEVFEFNEAVANAVTKEATKQELLEIAMAHGFEPMFTDGMQKAAQGITTAEEIIRVAKL
jgi:general secretion pathway protein E